MENETRPHFKPNSVEYTKGYGTRLAFNVVFNLIALAIALALAVSSIYIVIKQPIRTSKGYITVERTNSSIEHQTIVLVKENSKNNPFSPFINFLFTQEVYEAKIVAGPYGEITSTNGQYEVLDKDKIIKVNIEDPGDGYLDNQYIVERISNGADSSLDKIVDFNEILGLSK